MNDNNFCALIKQLPQVCVCIYISAGPETKNRHDHQIEIKELIGGSFLSDRSMYGTEYGVSYRSKSLEMRNSVR